MIICDGKHPKQVEGSRSLNVRGETKVGEHTIRFDFRMQAVNEHFCQEHMIEILGKMNIVDLAKNAIKAKARPKK